MSVLMCIRFCVIDGSDAMRTFDFIYVCIVLLNMLFYIQRL